jgi:hypothetical protein
MAELLAPFPSGSGPAPLVPAAVSLEGIKVSATGQACHVAVAVGADPPFFTAPGPLPTTGVEVVGLVRAANRYMSETPDAADVPLRVTAAAATSVKLASFEARLQPVPAPPADPTTSPPLETPYPVTVVPETRTAQLCDPSHSVAQPVENLPSGFAIASISLLVRAGGEPATGSVALHGGDDAPDAAPLRGAEAPLGAQTGGGSPDWVSCRLPEPVVPVGPVWAVCRITSGEALWFTGLKLPDGFKAARARLGDGDWTAAPAGGWAQLQLSLVATPR